MKRRLKYIRIAQICSDMAKEYSGLSSQLYSMKTDYIVKALNVSTKNKAHYDENEDVIYFETEVGQMSFHTNISSIVINHKNTIVVDSYVWDESVDCTGLVYDIDPEYYKNKENQILRKF